MGDPKTPSQAATPGTLDHAGSIIGATRPKEQSPAGKVTSRWCLPSRRATECGPSPDRRIRKVPDLPGRERPSEARGPVSPSLFFSSSRISVGRGDPLDDPRRFEARLCQIYFEGGSRGEVTLSAHEAWRVLTDRTRGPTRARGSQSLPPHLPHRAGVGTWSSSRKRCSGANVGRS